MMTGVAMLNLLVNELDYQKVEQGTASIASAPLCNLFPRSNSGFHITNADPFSIDDRSQFPIIFKTYVAFIIAIPD
jgi:hypothetical protein